MPQDSAQNDTDLGAEFEGVKVPHSPFLNEKMVKRIAKGIYERPERKLATKLTRESDRVLEMGAGLGFVGGFTAFHKKGVELLSFEANPELIPHVERLYQINGLSARASVENKLLIANPDRPDSMRFHIHGSYLGSSVYKVGRPNRPKIDIATIGWDDVKSRFRPDVLIMDIEGAELDFLTHADLSGVRAIIAEFHPDHYGKEGVKACIDAVNAQGLRQTHHRMEVRAFVAEGVEAPR
ncbi:FkbM family methyltransferase [Yoonia litorea]|uniref:Methyltransferase, FkbM family n=1 Tax=Yoonia litorea TaxID=1123755 RepID=A0A1I6MBZ0_9RHOB|nr:FkbM family methyltransferase [Yoonia litorea]SFS13270.1 methyltransferase, FkbM family [Yoonia litorea]